MGNVFRIISVLIVHILSSSRKDKLLMHKSKGRIQISSKRYVMQKWRYIHRCLINKWSLYAGSIAKIRINCSQ